MPATSEPAVEPLDALLAALIAKHVELPPVHFTAEEIREILADED